MLDPLKATIVNPGLDVNGQFSDAGIPASIVTKYLAEHGVIVEKTSGKTFHGKAPLSQRKIILPGTRVSSCAGSSRPGLGMPETNSLSKA